LRLFLAQRAFIDDYETLRADFAPCLEGRWRTPESLHATALFLGDRFEPERIVRTVASLALDLDDAPIEGTDRFTHNRIFYAGADHPSLASTSRRLAEAFGLTPRRRFVTHVTLMRYKQIDPDCFERKKTAWEHRKIGTVSGPLILMKSTLLPTGAVYEPLHIF